MTRFTSIVASALALSSMCSAHMILANPKPYGTPDNSPLTSSNYPCHISGDAATFYSTDGRSNTATAGDTVSMSFTGSAVHGGGSCQVALTTDMQPSASTRWSVILSIEGGCPSKDGSTASTYDVKIPEDIPAGDYSYAWTWTSKLSGTQEYYMNCAPITIKAGGGSKRDTELQARGDALDNYPPLAVYNLAEINSCKSVLSSDPQYPFPGDNVEKLLASGTPVYKEITGDNCFATGVTYDGSSSGSSSSSSSGSSGSSGSDSSSGSATTSAASEATSAAAASGGSPSGFLTSVVAATPAAAQPTAEAATSAAAAAPTGSTSGSSSSSSSSSSSNSSSGSESGSCTAGEYKCSSDGSSFQMCVSGGQWSTTMSVASGTSCTPGTSASLSIAAIKKRSGLPFLV